MLSSMSWSGLCLGRPRWRFGLLLLGTLWTGSACWAGAPTGREQLLRLVPADAGFCVVVSDLRGQWKKLQEAPWVKAFKDSSLGATLVRAPEFQRLVRLESDLKKHLQVDAAQLRDEIFGDALVFTYHPAPPGRPQDEEGLLLLWARNPTLLARVIDRFNQAPNDGGDLLKLSRLKFQGKTYFRRVERHKTQFYFLQGNLLALSSQEKRIRAVIEAAGQNNVKEPPLAKHLHRGGADRALAAMWINPRAFDADLKAKAQKQGGGRADPQAQVVKAFLQYWQAIDGIVLAASLAEEPEFRLSIQARTADLPDYLRALLSKEYQRSELWERFPNKAMVRLAGKIDFTALVELLRALTPMPARQALGTALKKNLAASLGLDPVKDFLPRLGPDWGMCIAAAAGPDVFPHVIVALAVQPGPKPVAAESALFKAAQFFIHLAVFEYNRTHPESIQIHTDKQGKIEVVSLTSPKVFPSGFQPAIALKDGYFLMVSSPDAIARFQKAYPAPAIVGEVPLLHISLGELSGWVRVRQEKLAAFLKEKNNLSPQAAQQWLDGLLESLSLFDHLVLTQRSDANQIAWIVRLRLAGKN